MSEVAKCSCGLWMAPPKSDGVWVSFGREEPLARTPWDGPWFCETCGDRLTIRDGQPVAEAMVPAADAAQWERVARTLALRHGLRDELAALAAAVGEVRDE